MAFKFSPHKPFRSNYGEPRTQRQLTSALIILLVMYGIFLIILGPSFYFGFDLEIDAGRSGSQPFRIQNSNWEFIQTAVYIPLLLLLLLRPIFITAYSLILTAIRFRKQGKWENRCVRISNFMQWTSTASPAVGKRGFGSQCCRPPKR